MEPLGAQLKAAREQKRVSVAQAAHDTRISANHLESFETGRYKSLPGGVYNRAFLRMYCEYLGLDPQPMLDRYNAETSTSTERPPKTAGRKVQRLESSFAPHPVMIWSVMLLVSVIALYLSRRWITDVFSPYFTHQPAPVPTLAKPEPQASAMGSVEPSSATPAPGGESAAAPAAAAETPLPPQLPGTVRLHLQITQRCWVSVTSDGNRVLVKLLEPGDSQTFDAIESLYVILGNAGGVQATINGKPARPFGKNGEVVKVSINAQNVNELLEQPDSPRNARQ